MNKIKTAYFFFAVLHLLCVSINAQNKSTKVLLRNFSVASTDTAKANCLNNLALSYLTLNNDSALFYAKYAMRISEKTNYVVGKTRACIHIANAYRHLDSTKKCLAFLDVVEKEKLVSKIGNQAEQKQTYAEWLYAKARVYETLDSLSFAKKMYKESVTICEQQQYYYLQSKNYIGLKFIASKQHNFKDALLYAFKSIEPLEKLKDSVELCKSYNNISNLYGQLNEHEKANQYLEVALKLAFKINRLDLASLMYCNMGIGYHELGAINPKMYDSAFFYAEKSLELAEKINDIKRKITAISLMGSCYLNTNQHQKALAVLHKGLGFANTLNDNYYKISISDHIGEVYQKTGKLDSAIYYGKKSLQYAQEINSLMGIEWAAENLSKTYQLKGDFKKAFEMQKLFYSMRDSVMTKDNQKELINQDLNYKYEKQSLADSLKYDAEKKITEIKNETTLKTLKRQLIIAIVVLITLIGLGLVLYNRFKITQKQKQIIEAQSKEIQDSIEYSKEIQTLFLKPIINNSAFFNDVLLIYKPKDVVSGDFYWNKTIGDNLFIVVGDCTGHGVPGAIISVLAIQSLEKLISGINNPNELHTLNNALREEFDGYYKTESRVSIGLDYSVLCINKKENTLYVSGSSSSVIIKDNSNNVTVERFDSINIGGKMPVVYNPKTTIQSINHLHSLYLYTDGVIDQRGGEESKKFGTKNLVSLIKKLNTNNTPQALATIETTLDNWKRAEVQIDDMTLLGLQIQNG